MTIQIAIVIFFGLIGGVLGRAIFLLPLKSPLNFWFGAVSGIFAGYFFYVRPCFNVSLNRHALILLALGVLRGALAGVGCGLIFLAGDLLSLLSINSNWDLRGMMLDSDTWYMICFATGFGGSVGSVLGLIFSPIIFFVRQDEKIDNSAG